MMIRIALLVIVLLAVVWSPAQGNDNAGEVVVPVIIDTAKGIAILPLEWWIAIRDAHNEQAATIRKLNQVTGCI